MQLLTWILDEEPKSILDQREWPMAVYTGARSKPAAFLLCSTRFTNTAMTSSNHLPITVVLCRYINMNDFRKMQYEGQTFRSVRDAIQFVESFLPHKREWHPPII